MPSKSAYLHSLIPSAQRSKNGDRPVPAMTKPKPVVCFVDDDQNELTRFAKAMADHYDVISGTSFPVCRRRLEERNLERPDLWVLDLYFPEGADVANTPDELNTMNSKYFRLREQIREFGTFLEGIGQGPSGGLALIEKCKALGGPVVMLTRKGTLEDAIRCFDHGASAVLKKPMPEHWPDDDDPEAVRKAMDDAMIANSQYLIARFEKTITEGSRSARVGGPCRYLWGIATGAVLAWCIQFLFSLLTQG